MKFRIYKPTKSAMQSGKKNTTKWLLEPISKTNERSINPVMGWISADDTSSQLRFKFSNKESAINFAKSRNFEYEIYEPNISSPKKKSYAANFTN